MGGGGGSKCSGGPIFVFFIKENWICAMTRYHAEPNINILLTRNLLFESEVREESHPLMILCIVCGPNGTMQRVINLILFIYVHSVVVVP